MSGRSMLSIILRGIIAVLAGTIVVVLTSLGADEIMYRTGGFPPRGQVASDGAFLVAALYRTLFGVAGAWVTALLAPDHPVRYALIYGAIGVLANAGGVAMTLRAHPSIGPVWYPLALLIVCLPSAWVGGKLVERAAGG